MQYSIVGDNLPAVIIWLNPGETIISQAGGRTWSRGQVLTETKGGSVGQALGRLLSGESLFMSHYTAQGPAEIAFTSSFPGQIIARELRPGESVICQKSAFLCATAGVQLSVHLQRRLGAGFLGGEGFIMQKVTGPGTVFFELDGYCPSYDLAPGEQIICDTGAVALMEDTCTMDVQMVRGIKNLFLGGEGLVDTVVTGPGRVHLQSMSVFKLAKLVEPYIEPKDDK